MVLDLGEERVSKMDIRLEDAHDFISCIFLYLQLRDIIMVFRNLYIE